jgi:hypothetical protein
MPEVLSALNAFLQEHRRYGELDSDVEEGRVWMTCDRDAAIARSILPHDSTLPRSEGRDL